MEANRESDKDTQVAIYNGMAAYPWSSFDRSFQQRKETLRQAIEERQQELENLPSGHIPGHPLSPYTNINV